MQSFWWQTEFNTFQEQENIIKKFNSNNTQKQRLRKCFSNHQFLFIEAIFWTAGHFHKLPVLSKARKSMKLQLDENGYKNNQCNIYAHLADLRERERMIENQIYSFAWNEKPIDLVIQNFEAAA